MRNFIIGISILFYTLAGIIIVKALLIPANNYQNHSADSMTDELSLKPQNISQQSDKKPIDDQAVRILAVLGDGMFGTGQDIVSEDLKDAVRALIQDIVASPNHRVIVEGHTDNIPIKLSNGKRYTDNMGLSLLRAKAVSQILVENGIPSNRISLVGYGDTRPIASNETEEGRAKNRRVEVKLVPENKEF